MTSKHTSGLPDGNDEWDKELGRLLTANGPRTFCATPFMTAAGSATLRLLMSESNMKAAEDVLAIYVAMTIASSVEIAPSDEKFGYFAKRLAQVAFHHVLHGTGAHEMEYPSTVQ